MRTTTITLDREEAALLEQLAAIQAKREHIAQVKAEKKAERRADAIARGVAVVITADGRMVQRVPEEGDVALEATGTDEAGYTVWTIPACVTHAVLKLEGFLLSPRAIGFRKALRANYKYDTATKQYNRIHA